VNLSREGTPLPPWDKHPAMISGRSSASLLPTSCQAMKDTSPPPARDRILMKHAWDEKYGGWYDLLDQSGKPEITTKSVPTSLYTNVGLALYLFRNPGWRYLIRIKESIPDPESICLWQQEWRLFSDPQQGSECCRQLKKQHSHYGYTAHSWLTWWWSPGRRRSGILQRSLCRYHSNIWPTLRDGWFTDSPLPAPSPGKWAPRLVNDREVVSAGAQLTASLALLRMYELTGKEIYRSKGIELSNKVMSTAYDSIRGCWFDVFDRIPPYTIEDSSSVTWWLQS